MTEKWAENNFFISHWLWTSPWHQNDGIKAARNWKIIKKYFLIEMKFPNALHKFGNAREKKVFLARNVEFSLIFKKWTRYFDSFISLQKHKFFDRLNHLSSKNSRRNESSFLSLRTIVSICFDRPKIKHRNGIWNHTIPPKASIFIVSKSR